jgi:hypothetical protein
MSKISFTQHQHFKINQTTCLKKLAVSPCFALHVDVLHEYVTHMSTFYFFRKKECFRLIMNRTYKSLLN